MKTNVAIIGAGPYGLSLSAHLAEHHVEHRIFGAAMRFWAQVVQAGSQRYLKAYCFGMNISGPRKGFHFTDYSQARGLETFEPCSMADFAAYGVWFQQRNVPSLDPTEVDHIVRNGDGFIVKLMNDECLEASSVILATGLTYFAHIPSALARLPSECVSHTSGITDFGRFRGCAVAVIGAGQSALEAAALLREAGALPRLLVRGQSIRWMKRVAKSRSVWRRLRSPLSALGSGPKAWALSQFPGAMHRAPASLRTRFVMRHLPAEGAWWLRDRIEGQVPIDYRTTVIAARLHGGRVVLKLKGDGGSARELRVDHVVAGTGYDIDVDRLALLEPQIRQSIRRLERAPMLNGTFETSVRGLYVIGPASVMSFGPLFRFVAGAEYTARVVSTHLALHR